MSMTVTSATNFGEQGNSISDPRFLYRASENAWRAAQNHYAPTITHPAVYPPVIAAGAVGTVGLPTVSPASVGTVGLPTVASAAFPLCTARLATNGATSATVAGHIAADLVAHPEVDIWICEWGRNDAVLGTNIVANSTTIFNAIVAAGKRFVYVNCLSNGEQGPLPANPHDADIATNDAAMATLVASYGASGALVDWRANVFIAYDSVNNWPGANLVSGPLTTPDPIGVHPLRGGIGGDLCSAEIANQWVYA